MQRPRVLVVEDRPSVLKVIATVLEDAYEVKTASEGETAISLIAAEPPDVVLTDVRMTAVTGFDVLRAAQRAAPPAEVVMMTAYANVPDAVAAIKLGAYDYVPKPIEADEISLVVARAVEHRREREQRDGEAGPAAEVSGLRPDDSRGPPGEFHRAIEEARDRASRAYLADLLRLFRGNVTRAAVRAGMTRESLHRLLRRYGVRSEDYRTDDGAVSSAPMGDTRGA
jgi:DNA-binding NtrC family response regulator